MFMCSHHRLLAQGMSRLHSKGGIHRNLTPSNVLIAADGRICVCDFGAAQVLENPALDKGRDARAYYAPYVETFACVCAR